MSKQSTRLQGSATEIVTRIKKRISEDDGAAGYSVPDEETLELCDIVVTLCARADASATDDSMRLDACPRSDGNACEQYRLQGQRCQDCPIVAAAPATGETREAFLLAANVASIVRDEYYARSKEEGLSPVQRERYTYASTIAKQIKGEILAYAGIQEWPAPKPIDAARAADTEATK